MSLKELKTNPVMVYEYKYKAPYRIFKVSTFIVIILSSVILFYLILSMQKFDIMPMKDIIILASISTLCIIIMSIAIYDLRKNILIFLESKRNPSITVDDNSILLPFEKNKKRIKVFFKDCIECGEDFFLMSKSKSYFIYFMVTENENINNPKIYEYKIYKDNMGNTEEYNDLKNYLLKRINNRNK